MKKTYLLRHHKEKRTSGKVGVIFQVCPGNSEERITKEIPEEIVEELSLQKAMAVASKFDMEDGTIILGADTIVSFDGKILGKPRNEEEAVNTLMMLQGNTHQVYTGVTVMEQRENSSWRRSLLQNAQMFLFILYLKRKFGHMWLQGSRWTRPEVMGSREHLAHM